MHFMDPQELGGLHGFAGPSAGKAASTGGRTCGAARTMLHKYTVSSANRMS